LPVVGVAVLGRRRSAPPRGGVNRLAEGQGPQDAAVGSSEQGPQDAAMGGSDRFFAHTHARTGEAAAAAAG